MLTALKELNKNLQNNKTISKDEVIKIELATNSNFITESIPLDKFSKTRTTLYVNDVITLINKKMNEYEKFDFNSTKSKHVYLNILDNIKYLEDLKKSWNELYPIFDFLNRVEFAQYEDSTETYCKISEDSSITEQILNKNFLKVFPQFNTLEVFINNEIDSIIKYDSMLMYLINHYSRTIENNNDIKINYIMSYKLSIKDFKKYCIEDKELVSKAIDSLICSLVNTGKMLFNPTSVLNYKDKINEGLNIVESLNKHKDNFYFYKVAKEMLYCSNSI